MSAVLIALEGVNGFDDQGIVAALREGEPLTLIRGAPGDLPWAVEVWARGRPIGRLAAANARPVAMAHDAAAECFDADEPPFTAHFARDGDVPSVEIEGM